MPLKQYDTLSEDARSLPILKKTSLREFMQLRQSIRKILFKKQIEQELKQNWTEGKMYGQFVREMPENVDKNKTWQWLSKCDLKIGTEALLCAAQEQAIRM